VDVDLTDVIRDRTMVWGPPSQVSAWQRSLGPVALHVGLGSNLGGVLLLNILDATLLTGVRLNLALQARRFPNPQNLLASSTLSGRFQVLLERVGRLGIPIYLAQQWDWETKIGIIFPIRVFTIRTIKAIASKPLLGEICRHILHRTKDLSNAAKVWRRVSRHKSMMPAMMPQD